MTRKKIADNEPVVPVEGAAAAPAPAKSPAKQNRAPRASANPVTHKHKKAMPAVQSPVTPSVPAIQEYGAPVQTAQPQPAAPTQDEIARLAYSYWEARGCQGGSMADDWFRAEQELLSRSKD